MSLFLDCEALRKFCEKFLESLHPRSFDDGEWDMKGDGYRVIIQGKWNIVPADAVVSGPNKFGKAMVWLREGAIIGNPIVCFIPGSGV